MKSLINELEALENARLECDNHAIAVEKSRLEEAAHWLAVSDCPDTDGAKSCPIESSDVSDREHCEACWMRYFEGGDK